MEPIREAEMQTQPGKRLNEESKKNGKVWKIVVGVVAAAVVVFFGACCILAHASTAFFPHTAINGVDVSGLTLQEAQSRLETVLPQRVCKIYLSEQNTVSPEEREPAASITFAELGISPEAGYDGTTKSAYILQHGKGYCSTGFTYLKSLLGKNTGYNSSLYWDSRQLDQAIARLSAVLNSKPLDMAFQVGDHSLQLTIAKDGRSVADNELRRSIQNVVQVSSEPEAIVDLPAEILPAKALTAQQLYDQLHGEVRNASYDSATDSIVPEQLGADFDIAAVQLELVCNTGVSKTVENYFGKIVFLNQLLQCTVDGGLFGRHSQRAGDHKIIVSVLCAQCIPCHVLIGFILDKHFSNCFGEKDGSDTAVCFGAFQNLNRGTAGTQRGKTSDDIFVFQGV